MATKCVVNKSTMTGIADAIRAKGGTSDTLLPSEMPAAIQAIPSGSSYPKPWKNDGDMYVWIRGENDGFRLYFNFAITNKNSPLVIDWGDGTSNTVSASLSELKRVIYTHNYERKGEYLIHVSGYDEIKTRSRSFSGNNGGSVSTIVDSASCVLQVETGDSRFSQIGGVVNNGFYYCFNMVALKTFAAIESYALNFCKGLLKIEGSPSITGKDYSFNECNSLLGPVVCTGNSIGMASFTNCFSLADVVIPFSVENIGRSSFRSSSSLTSSIEIGDECTTIGSNAFSCSSIRRFAIGSGITSIENNAFDTCEFLTEFVIAAQTPPTLGSNVFRSSNSQLKIIVPYSADHSILNAYKSATNWSAYASKMIEAEEA